MSIWDNISWSHSIDIFELKFYLFFSLLFEVDTDVGIIGRGHWVALFQGVNGIMLVKEVIFLKNSFSKGDRKTTKLFLVS